MQFTVTSSLRMHSGDDDQRYRISIFLLNQHRPKYWSFHCNYCGTKICELSGQLVYLTDTDDVNNYVDRTAPVVIRCNGRNKGEYCRMFYEFNTMV